MRRGPMALILIAALALGTTACGGGGGGDGDGGAPNTLGIIGGAEGDVVGLIVDVGASGGEVDRFTVETDEGKRHVIYLDPAIDYGLRQGVLEENQQAKTPVRVGTEEREGKLYATVILNA